MKTEKYNFIHDTQMFYFIMKQLYDGAPDSLKMFSFEDMMNNNITRADFVISLLNSNDLSKEQMEQINDIKMLLVDFIVGTKSKSIYIDEDIINDKDDNCIIFSRNEFQNLLNNLRLVNKLYTNYASKDISLNDDKDNVITHFSIDKSDLTNIMGISDIQVKDFKEIKNSWKKFWKSGRVDDYILYANNKCGKKPNLLLKHFFLKKANEKLNKFYDYIISDEGIEDLQFLYDLQNEFIKIDKEKNPSRYIDGKIDFKKKVEFQNDYYEFIKNKYYKEIPYSYSLKELMKREFPLLKLSKYYTFLSNFINLLNMNDLYFVTYENKKLNDVSNLKNQFEVFRKQLTIFFDDKEKINNLDYYFYAILDTKSQVLECYNKFKLVLENLLLEIDDEETKKSSCEFLKMIDDYIYFNDEKSNECVIVNGNYQNGKNYLNVFTLKNEKLVSSITTKKDEYQYHLSSPRFVDKVLCDNQIIRISSIEEEISFLEYCGLNQDKKLLLNEKKEALRENLQKFYVRDNVDNIVLKNKYLHIVAIVSKAIDSNNVIYLDHKYDIYKNNKLLTSIDEENMRLLGIFEKQYLNRSIIADYLEKNKLMSK